jgi:S1-C subfamily serine protease
MRDGRVRRARLGVAAQTITLDHRLARRLNRPSTNAVMLSEIIDGGAASRSGLVEGDILLKLDDHILAGVDDLHRLLTLERANKPGNLTILRGSHIESVAIMPEADD